MGATHHPPVSDANLRIRDVVRRELHPYGAQAATVEVTWSEGWDSWLVDVTPTNDAAASLELGVDDRHSLHLVVGNSNWEEAFETVSMDWIRRVVRGVFAGQVREIGRRSGFASFVRIGPQSAVVASFGAAHIPVPWILRRVHRYSAY